MLKLLIILFALFNDKYYCYDFYCVMGARKNGVITRKHTIKLRKWIHPA